MRERESACRPAKKYQKYREQKSTCKMRERVALQPLPCSPASLISWKPPSILNISQLADEYTKYKSTCRYKRVSPPAAPAAQRRLSLASPLRTLRKSLHAEEWRTNTGVS
jgi:hypothetical protein